MDTKSRTSKQSRQNASSSSFMANKSTRDCGVLADEAVAEDDDAVPGRLTDGVGGMEGMSMLGARGSAATADSDALDDAAVADELAEGDANGFVISVDEDDFSCSCFCTCSA